MPLVVETGAGLELAEAYVSVAELDEHCVKWGFDLGNQTTAQKETLLRKATAFIDTFGEYRGSRLRAEQALEFPRADLSDRGGHPVTGVPLRVKRAVCDLAFKAMDGDLLEDLERGGRVQSESVGPISTTYAADAPAGVVYQMAEKLLSPYLRGAELDLTGPAYGDLGDAYFSAGMHDFAG